MTNNAIEEKDSSPEYCAVCGRKLSPNTNGSKYCKVGSRYTGHMGVHKNWLEKNNMVVVLIEPYKYATMTFKEYWRWLKLRSFE